jgi:hypothetical protein
MNLKKAAFLSAMLLLMPVAAGAQSEQAPARPSVFSDYLHVQTPGTFLSIPGLSFSSSVGFSFFSGGDRGSAGMGYYMGHFGLALSESITLRWDVGVGSLMKGTDEYRQPEFFLPNVDLTYRPSDTFMLRLQFQQSRWPGYYLMPR